MPVMQMQHVHGSAVGPQRLQRGAAEHPEPPRVVDIVAGRIAVEAIAVEGGRQVHQPQPIAVRPDVEDRDLAHARRGARIRDPHHRRAEDLRWLRRGHGSVPWQEDIDRGLDLGRAQRVQRASERVDDIGESAGLRPGLAFGGKEHDAQWHGPRIVVARAPGRHRT